MAILTSISQGLNINPRVVTAAGAITVTSTDYCVMVKKTVGAATTVNLPVMSSGESFVFTDAKGDAATNNITVTPASGTINGAATYVINTNYGSVSIVGDGGTNWLIISKN
jgi:L-ascorbate metabolism protein UlaG (beta-lactamase superfamily)